jgi:NhaA family Na+:H+ antiporter
MPYLLLGIALWIFIHSAGVHATIAGVLLAFAIPVKSSIKEKDFIENTKYLIDVFEQNIDKIDILNHYQIDALKDISYNYNKVQNPLIKLEHQLYTLSAFVIMPLFAFSNAGVIFNFSAVNDNMMIVLGVVFGLLIGKPIGIVGFTYFVDKLKIVKKPDSLLWSEIIAVGFLGGIGFTMSIFVTQLAYVDESIMDAVKLGIFLASLLSGLIAVILLLRINHNNKM